MVYFAHNLIVGEVGEVGENPTLTRNRERFLKCKSDYQLADKEITTRRGLRGGDFFRHREISFVSKGSHVQEVYIFVVFFNSLYGFLNSSFIRREWLSVLGLLPGASRFNHLERRDDRTICRS